MNNQTIEFNIYDYVTVLRKRLVWVVLITLAVVTVVSFQVYSKPLLFSTRIKVLFEYVNPAAGLMHQSFYFTPQRIIPELEEEKILNSKILGRVAKQLKITRHKPETPAWYNEVNRLKSFIKIKFQNTQNMNMSYSNQMMADIISTTPSPTLSKNLLNVLVEQYELDQQEYKIEQDIKTRNWLDTQLIEAKAKIEEAERAFQEFKQTKGILSIEELQGAQIANFSVLEKAYNDAIQNRKNLELQVNSLNEALTLKEETSNLIFSNSYPEISKLVSELSTYNLDLKNALQTFKGKHPKIMEINDKISLTKERIEIAKQDAIKSLHIQIETARTFEQIKLKDMTDYKKQALYVSNDALQYTLLERDVESNRQLYDLLAQRLKESAVQNSISSVNIRVIEPSILPMAPISKRYPSKLFSGLILGLALGIFVAFIIEFIDMSIRTPEDVKNLLNQPVVGMIPIIENQFDEGKVEELVNMLVKNYEKQRSTT